MALELEAKFTDVDVAACRASLDAQGFACVRPWSLMRRYTYFLTELNPSAAKWARVRDNGDGSVSLTFKHEHDSSHIHGTEEVEVAVDSFDNAAELLQKLGFENCTYQENYRETWTKGDLEVTLNEWPALPAFMEVEGPSEAAVQAGCEMLGFAYSDAMFGGVGRLYGANPQWAGRNINDVRELTFARAPELLGNAA